MGRSSIAPDAAITSVYQDARLVFQTTILEYLLFILAVEGHEFRKAETLRRALELDLDFYGRVFGFTAPGLSERVIIANMPASKT